jgi:chemotaxis protein MotB
MALAKKQKQAEEGAPAWMVTYGDMVTLLLTFFVLLLSMSEIKTEQRIIEFMSIIREAFGYQGGVRPMPTDPIEVPKNFDLPLIIVPPNPEQFSKSDEEGVRGRSDLVKPIKDADRFVLGAPIKFDELSAELSSEQREAVRQFADQIRGFYTQIELRGHASQLPVDDSAYSSHSDLSYQRARVVAAALEEFGVDPKRLIVVAAGTKEPLAEQAYRESQRARNNIVEIFQLSTSATGLSD